MNIKIITKILKKKKKNFVFNYIKQRAIIEIHFIIKNQKNINNYLKN